MGSSASGGKGKGKRRRGSSLLSRVEQARVVRWTIKCEDRKLVICGANATKRAKAWYAERSASSK